MSVKLTNDSSSVSKCSAARAGYYQDDFIRYFVGKHARRSPLIHRGYFIRVVAVQHLLCTFLRHCGGRAQVLSLGAGFDTTFFRLKAAGVLGDCVQYVEVDFPDVMERKIAVIQSQEALTAQLKEVQVTGETKGLLLHSDGYSLVGLDLQSVHSLSPLLSRCRVNPTLPTLVLSECVLTYIKPESSSQVISWAASTFSNALFITYEQVHPQDGFGQVMRRHFTSLGSPLRCISSFPTPRAQKERYTTLGWEVSAAVDMHFFHRMLSEEERLRIRQLELFDEFEEWHLKCSHYVVVCSGKGELSDVVHTLHSQAGQGVGEGVGLEYGRDRALAVPVTLDEGVDVKTLQRFGQASVVVPSDGQGEGGLLMFGGFGPAPSAHGRLSDLMKLTLTDHAGDVVMRAVRCAVEGEGPGEMIGALLYPSLSVLRNGSVVLFGGRTSPAAANSRAYLLRPVTAAAQDSVANGYMWLPLETKGEAPSARWRHSASVVQNERGEEVLVVLGGRSPRGEVLSNCHQLHLPTLSWSKSACPYSFHSHSAEVWRNKVVVFGGLDSDDVPLSRLCTATVMDPSTVLFEEVVLAPSLPARYSCSSAVCGDHLLLVGGVDWNASNPDIIAISLATRQWSMLHLTLNIDEPLLCYGMSCWLPRELNCCHGQVPPQQDGRCARPHLILLGGGGNCFSFGTHFNSQPLLLTVGELP